MAQRVQASKEAAAARGQLRVPLPVGYLHDEAGAVVIDPDAEVQAAIRDVFAAFTACGSAYWVVAAFAGRRFPLRAYGGVWAGQLRWGALTHARVLGVLKNPCYAGAYVHGRYTARRAVCAGSCGGPVDAAPGRSAADADRCVPAEAGGVGRALARPDPRGCGARQAGRAGLCGIGTHHPPRGGGGEVGVPVGPAAGAPAVDPGAGDVVPVRLR